MNDDDQIKGIVATADSVRIEWLDGERSELASIWLRDNRPEDRDPLSGQRLIDIADLPAQPGIRSAQVREGKVTVSWLDDTAAVFDAAWLAAYARPRRSYAPERHRQTWLYGGSLNAAHDCAWTTLKALNANSADKLDWLIRLLTSGIGFVRDVPQSAAATLEATALFGTICPTNYGFTFDVRSVAQPDNLAYSDLGLGLHTDNPYREPVPGFQALHVLLAAPNGGVSLFADGFAIAEHLRLTDPAAFETLSHTLVPFHYRSKNADLYAERPLLELSANGALRAVHYNNRSIAPLRLTLQDATVFYAAYRSFAALLREPHFQLKYSLLDGDLVVFDNQRILHGRTVFSSAQHDRHLHGCYLTRDSVYSTTALLRSELNRMI